MCSVKSALLLTEIEGVHTELGRNHDPDTAEQLSKVSAYWKTIDEGCSTTLVAALDPSLNGKCAYICGIK